MTLDGMIALIVRYFTEFDSFDGRLRYSTLRSDAEYHLLLIFRPELTHAAVT